MKKAEKPFNSIFGESINDLPEGMLTITKQVGDFQTVTSGGLFNALKSLNPELTEVNLAVVDIKDNKKDVSWRCIGV